MTCTYNHIAFSCHSLDCLLPPSDHYKACLRASGGYIKMLLSHVLLEFAVLNPQSVLNPRSGSYSDLVVNPRFDSLPRI